MITFVPICTRAYSSSISNAAVGGVPADGAGPVGAVDAVFPPRAVDAEEARAKARSPIRVLPVDAEHTERRGRCGFPHGARPGANQFPFPIEKHPLHVRIHDNQPFRSQTRAASQKNAQDQQRRGCASSLQRKRPPAKISLSKNLCGRARFYDDQGLMFSTSMPSMACFIKPSPSMSFSDSSSCSTCGRVCGCLGVKIVQQSS